MQQVGTTTPPRVWLDDTLNSPADHATGETGPASNFAFQTGHWNVRHRKLKRRLAGDTEWSSFTGRCQAWEIMGGAGNIEDNVFDDPAGRYRAAALRHCDPQTGLWSIWWLDGRVADLDAPMRGRFQDGVGIFLGQADLTGQPVDVRFIWSGIGLNHARWEQAFARRGGDDWETNWVMDFSRDV